MTGMVTKRGALYMQVCVPRDWNDHQVKTFADSANKCGTEHGWHIRRNSNAARERVTCAEDKARVHIMLDA